MRFLLPLLAVLSLLTGCTSPVPSPPLAPRATPLPAVRLPLLGTFRPPAATPQPADTSAAGMARVWADVRRRAYFLDAPADQSTGTCRASNEAQHLTAELAATRYELSAPTDSAHPRPAWQVAFQLRGVGRAGAPGLPLPQAGSQPVSEQDSATYGHGGAVAVDYRNSPAGLRQSFRLARRPLGNGPVQVQFTLDTDLQVTAEGGQALRFSRQGEDVLRYDGLRAWDATGRVLPARLQRSKSQELALVVDDADATYPLTIDPLASTAATTLTGAATGNDFGYSVAGAGDVNGDGYSDVLVGAYSYSTNTGRAYLFMGSSTGLSSTAATTLTGAATGNNFGWSVASAGDINGDGYGDVIVGAYAYSSSTGRAYVYLGSVTGLATTAATTLTGETTGSRFGFSVAGAGDINGDGYGDVIVGAYAYSTNTGRTYVYLGSATGLGTTAATTLTGVGTNDYFGYSVAGAGDVNGDGYSDVLVGAYGYLSSTGRTYVYLGSSTGLTSTATTTLTGETTSNQFGQSVAGAGDVNGDGYSDVVVGAYRYSSNTGRAYLYLGSAGTLTTTATTLTGETTSNSFGGSVAGAGDVNGDGYSDVVVGAYGYSSNTGRVYLYLGSATGLAGTATTTLTGAATNNYFGISVASAGDVNGDGYGDVVVGASGYSNNTGRTYVYLGSATGLAGTAATTLTGAATTAYFGVSVAGAEDVNGDGYSDVVVGALGYSSFTGRAFVYLGSATGLATSAATTLTGAAASNYFGNSVASAGDVNGDGYSDVVVGAYGNSTNVGRAYLYLGSATGLATNAATTLTGAAATNYFGYCVAGAGDVNGDGYSDVIVGAYGYSSQTGRAYVYLGSETGLATTAATTLTGTTSSRFGYCVASAGDVNGDGYSDVVVGAYQYSSNTGRAYLYLGSATGLASTITATLTGGAANSYFGYSAASAGDVNGDGYSDVIVGASGVSSSTGETYTYTGNEQTGRRAGLRLLNTDLSTVLSAANGNARQFGIGLQARSTVGRTRARLVWDTAPPGTPFAGATAGTASTAATGRGAWTDLGTAGTELTALVAKAGAATRVRARLEYASAALGTGSTIDGTGGLAGAPRYGPWRYVSNSFVAGAPATPLPVELSQFTAHIEGDAVRLRWTTTSEQANSHFAVERSLDGQEFTRIGEVKGQGSKASPTEYGFLDDQLPTSPPHQLAYYRLQQVDADGTSSYSPVRTVRTDNSPLHHLTISPNPTADVALLSGAAPGAGVQVLDLSGRVLLATRADEAGTVRLLLAPLPAGVYLLRSGSQATRLVRE